jgi:hypothetical protein
MGQGYGSVSPGEALMYPTVTRLRSLNLGKFSVPQTENWVPGVTYTPEPPLVIRGAMNPWAQERTREVYLAEEQAWKKIITLQAEYRALYAQSEILIARHNALIQQLEKLTGKKSGLLSAQNIGLYVLQNAIYAAGGPWGYAFMAVKLGVEFLLGNLKKKKIQKTIKELETLNATLTALYQKLEGIGQQVGGLVQTGDVLRSTQAARIQQDLTQSETLYQQRQSLDRLRADVLRERTRQVAQLYPARQGDRNGL